MKSTTINQLIANYIHQQNSNKNITIKKLPTQTNQNKKIYYPKDKNIKNPSVKSRRRPRCFNTNTNRDNFELNNKKLKSCSRYKNIKNNINYKNKNLAKLTKPNMNRTICTDGYGNIITNTHDRNLSAPSLNYEINYKKIKNKKKKNNIIKLNKADKKIIDENLINKDNYMKHFEIDNNSFKDNNINSEINDDKITTVAYNNNNEIGEKYLDKNEKNDEYNKLINNKEDIFNNANIHKNNLNINNFYKNINNKKYDNNDNSKADISSFFKNIEAIKSKRETINLLKEQLKAQEYNNKPKLNKTINSSNINQINNKYDNNKNKTKKINRINLVNKSGFAISNLHNYNKNTVEKKNKNKININKTNNTCLNETNNISKDLTPNKQFDNTMRDNINLSNSSNNRTVTISTNITNNNNIGKKINLSNVYTEQNDREKNNNIFKNEDKLINKSEDNININQFDIENNKEEKNITDINNENSQIYGNKSNNINDISDNINENLINKDNNKNYNNKINHEKNEKNEKQNYIYLQKQNKNKNINSLNKGINTLSLNIKNKNNNNLKKNNNIKEKKENIYNIIKKQSKNIININKKKYIVKKNYNTNNNNDINLMSSRYNTLNNERNNNFYNNIHNRNRNKVNNKDKSFDIVNNKKEGNLKINNKSNKSISKSKEKYKKYEDSNSMKKNSYNNANNNKSVDIISDRNRKINIDSHKEHKNISKNDFKSKSIFKIGVVCEPGEIVFGEKKTNQDNFFNSVINDDLRFIGVCDGHGEHGHHVSKFLRNNLPKQLEKFIQKLYKKEEINKTLLDNEMSGYYNENKDSKTNINPINNEPNINTNNNNIFEKIKKVFEKSFSKTDKSLSQYCQNLSKIKKEQSSEEEENEESIFDVEYSGSTCVSILLKEKNINKIYIANVGDSRAIIIKELQKNFIPYQLSRDHKPSEQDEAQRVLDYDGEIEKIEDDDGNWTGPLRVWVKGSDGPGLAMTRSFGDEVGASVGVVSVPEIGEYKIKEEDKAIIIASDGLWEYMSNEEVTDVVKNLIDQNNADIISKKLYEQSIIRWRLKDQGIDDITIICILLKEC